MHTATASKNVIAPTTIGLELARRGSDILLAVDEGNVLIQCHVSSAVAAAMLAPLGGDAVGQFRTLPGGMIEIDAAVTLSVAGRMLAARDAVLASTQRVH